jgi:L-ascorbate metabolism protein UlaG (beta-lactamase superfamily)
LRLSNTSPGLASHTLTPEQAAAAAKLLGAAVTCPIHYNLFNHPPVYMDSPGVEAAF